MNMEALIPLLRKGINNLRSRMVFQSQSQRVDTFGIRVAYQEGDSFLCFPIYRCWNATCAPYSDARESKGGSRVSRMLRASELLQCDEGHGRRT